MSQSLSAFSAPLSGGRKPVTWAGVAMCERSVATWSPADQYRLSGETINDEPSNESRIPGSSERGSWDSSDKGTIGTHPDRVDDIVERELSDERIQFEEK